MIARNAIRGGLLTTALILTLGDVAVADGDQHEYAKLSGSHGETWFGFDVCFDGDQLAVSASPNAGVCAAYVFERQAGVWTETGHVVASDGTNGDKFGSAIALQGDTLIVGASDRDELAYLSGTAYVFVRQGTTWVEIGKLAHDCGQLAGFGYDLALQDETLVVGCESEDRVFVYRGAGATWVLDTILEEPTLPSFSRYGKDVAIDGGTLVVGSYNYMDEADSRVFVYERTGGAWALADELGPWSYTGYVSAVAVSGDRLVVGHAGFGWESASVYRREASGWVFDVRLDSDEYLSRFGESVAIDGDALAIGAPNGDVTFNSEGYVLWYTRGANGWTRRGRLLASDPKKDSILGYHVDLQEREVVGGAWFADPLGGAYLFDLSCHFTDSYCTSTVNSSGEAATIDWSGSTSVLANDFTLVAQDCPATTPGLFIYGAHFGQQPFGDGYLCLGPGSPGILRLNPVTSTDSGGTALRLLDFPNLPPSGAIEAGSTWYFQYWFRDPWAGNAGFNLTDGLEVSFCP